LRNSAEPVRGIYRKEVALSEKPTAIVKHAGNSAGDGLKGYTGQSVNIQSAGWIYTYNEKGAQTGVTPAR
jgi:hypothetical protein